MNDKKQEQKRADIVRKVLYELFPNPKVALNFSNNIELLFSVILSAQCTDKKVNEVTAKLFKKYRSLNDYLKADFEEFAQDIRSTGFYRSKAKNILGAAKKLNEDFKGKVPKTMAELITIPGVARKTANVVLAEAYGVYEGMAVDTHIMRLSQKFGLTAHSEPVKIEKDLIELIPRDEWRKFALALILYGREYSPAHKKTSNDDPISQALLANVHAK